jgi:hypothetical protein
VDAAFGVDGGDEVAARPGLPAVDQVLVREGESDDERRQRLDDPGTTLFEPGALDRVVGSRELAGDRHAEHRG